MRTSNQNKKVVDRAEDYCWCVMVDWNRKTFSVLDRLAQKITSVVVGLAQKTTSVVEWWTENGKFLV